MKLVPSTAYLFVFALTAATTALGAAINFRRADQCPADNSGIKAIKETTVFFPPDDKSDPKNSCPACSDRDCSKCNTADEIALVFDGQKNSKVLRSFSRVLVGFDISHDIPKDGKINECKLEFPDTSGASAIVARDLALEIFKAKSSDWDPSNVNYSNAPEVGDYVNEAVWKNGGKVTQVDIANACREGLKNGGKFSIYIELLDDEMVQLPSLKATSAMCHNTAMKVHIS
ncbi:hypothetical protein H4219_002066 [Mycoemilia scoparia]|uniref:Carbohydrate-binding module family 96 domain-containing protein n=1 Tax=Mycoemilia scoparia TaxID=417184 RepID=A0A9W7ZZB8_9FUNG|nr:hypothetical protein H4219_002066 [Mycoemilia scoparia]